MNKFIFHTPHRVKLQNMKYATLLPCNFELEI